MNLASAQKLANLIQKEYEDSHALRTSWSGEFGQWLVYGFERKIGFFAAADLCAACERAHKKKGRVEEAALEFFIKTMKIRKPKTEIVNVGKQEELFV